MCAFLCASQVGEPTLLSFMVTKNIKMILMKVSNKRPLCYYQKYQVMTQFQSEHATSIVSKRNGLR